MTVHDRPCSDATRATARPWFPAVAHTTPRFDVPPSRASDPAPRSDSDISRWIAYRTPTILKAFKSKRAVSSLTDTAPRPREAASAGRLRSGVGESSGCAAKYANTAR